MPMAQGRFRSKRSEQMTTESLRTALASSEARVRELEAELKAERKYAAESAGAHVAAVYCAEKAEAELRGMVKSLESRLSAQAGELEFAIAVIREETGWTDEEVRPWIQKRALAALPAPQESVPGECQDCVGPGVKVCPDCSRCVEHCEHMPACLPGCAFSGPHTGLCMVNHPPEPGKGEV